MSRSHLALRRVTRWLIYNPPFAEGENARRPRWLAVLAVVAIAAVVCAFTVRRADACRACAAALRRCDSRRWIYLDATNNSFLQRPRSARAGDTVDESASGPPVQSRDSWKADSATVSLRAGVLPGDAELRVAAPGFTAQEITLQTTLDAGDAIGDGTPDFLRLHDPADRAAFRRWFTLLAESQYYRSKAVPEIDDCAALLRFAYREALREHDAVWARAMSLPAPASAVDVEQYQYPYTPLAASLFRVRGGAFKLAISATAPSRNSPTWTQSAATTHSMWGGISAAARPGDLLFFRQDGPKMPFHAMIFLGRSQIESGDDQFVIYHTGPTGKSQGNPSLVGYRTRELSGSSLASDSLQPGISRFLSLEHPAGRRLMRPNRAIVAVLLCCALIAPLWLRTKQTRSRSSRWPASERICPARSPLSRFTATM